MILSEVKKAHKKIVMLFLAICAIKNSFLECVLKKVLHKRELIFERNSWQIS